MPIRLLFHLRLQEDNLPLTWIAHETGLSVPTLRRLKNERSASIKFDMLEKLCEALHCEPGELFEFVPNPATRHEWSKKRARQKQLLRDKLNAPVVRNLDLMLTDDDEE